MLPLIKPVFAQGVQIGDQLSDGNGGSLPITDPGTLVSLILRNSLTLIGIILLILLISGGIMYIIGAGNNDPKKAAQAQTLLTDSLIGFAVVFLAYFIIQIIQVITGLEILNPSL